MKFILIAFSIAAVTTSAAPAAANTGHEADVCVYGSTPGGIACAVQEGLTVLLATSMKIPTP